MGMGGTGRLWRPETRAELRAWVSRFAGVSLPEAALCAEHQSPLDYLEYSFFERGEEGDAVVWACRGGGKTMIGAVATLLDMVFKPPLEVRILGGSLEQSERMFGYLRRMAVETGMFRDLVGGATRRRIRLRNGSAVEVLAQSERAVRGQRVQKLRCDEVELFDPAVWSAGQLATRGLREDESPWGAVRGSVEVYSTMHQPGGLMKGLLAGEGPVRDGRRVFTWCIWDVMATCHPERPCAGCPLWADCQGRGKGSQGFVLVRDVIAMRRRVSRAVWEHEMLCLPPRLENAVFAAFREGVHVRALSAEQRRARLGERVLLDGRSLRLEACIAGLDYGYVHAFVCLWMLMLRDGLGRRVVWVMDELVTKETTLAGSLAAVRARCTAVELPLVVYADCAGRHKNDQTGRSNEEVLRAAGFTVRSQGMGIEESVEMVAGLLDPADGAARLAIDPRCVRLVAALEGYRRGDDGKPVKDGVHDHAIDALRYAVFNHDRPGGKVEERVY